MTASPTGSVTWAFVVGVGVTVLWNVVGDVH